MKHATVFLTILFTLTACGGLTDEQKEENRVESMVKAAHADLLKRIEAEKKATEAYAKAKRASVQMTLDSIPTCAHDGMVCETDGWSQRTKPSSDADLSTYCFYFVANGKIRYYPASEEGFDRCVTERKRFGGTTCQDASGTCGHTASEILK